MKSRKRYGPILLRLRHRPMQFHMMMIMKMISSDSISDFVSPEDCETGIMIQKGRSAAISWIGIARKSSGRVTAYLQQQGFENSIIIQILESLQDDGYIDDERMQNV